MTVIWDPSGDFALLADGFESVTLLPRGYGPPRVLDGVLRRGVSLSRFDRRSVPARHETLWLVPEALLPGGAIAGDVLRDAAGRRWTVFAATLSSLGRWQVWTRDVAAARDLHQRVDVEAAEATKDEHGAEALTWRLLTSGVPGRFVAYQHTWRGKDDSPPAEASYRVLLACELPEAAAVRLVACDGRRFRVASVEERTGPGEPLEMTVTPEPVS